MKAIKMGQQEIDKFLRKHKGKWFNSRELAEATGVAMNRVTSALRVMLRYEKRLERKGYKKRIGYEWRFR